MMNEYNGFLVSYEMAYEDHPNHWTPISGEEARDLLGEDLFRLVTLDQVIRKDGVIYRKRIGDDRHCPHCGGKIE
jgi:hypothetical protein